MTEDRSWPVTLEFDESRKDEIVGRMTDRPKGSEPGRYVRDDIHNKMMLCAVVMAQEWGAACIEDGKSPDFLRALDPQKIVGDALAMMAAEPKKR